MKDVGKTADEISEKFKKFHPRFEEAKVIAEYWDCVTMRLILIQRKLTTN